MILDTCALLWLAEGGQKLGKRAKELIAAEPVVHVSAISGFEIALKHAQRKLHLPALPGDWLDVILKHHGLVVVPLSLDVCVLSTQLPAVHRDPCDRFIIATARLNRWPVATADPVFHQYEVEVVW